MAGVLNVGSRSDTRVVLILNLFLAMIEDLASLVLPTKGWMGGNLLFPPQEFIGENFDLWMMD